MSKQLAPWSLKLTNESDYSPKGWADNGHHLTSAMYEDALSRLSDVVQERHDLLEALDNCITVIAEWRCHNKAQESHDAALLRLVEINSIARAAIAKATGKTS